MKKTTTILAIALSSALTLTAVSNVAFAAKAATTEQKQNVQVYVIDHINIPGHAKSVLTDTHSARLAIFDGQSAAALDLVKKARASFGKDIAKYALQLPHEAGYGVPVDNSISFAKGYKPDATQAEIIAAAGRIAKSGDANGAFKKMLDANIALEFKYAMLPVSHTVAKLDKAYADLKAKRFYEANLALKAVETSMVVEGFAAGDNPQQGFDWEVITK